MRNSQPDRRSHKVMMPSPPDLRRLRPGPARRQLVRRFVSTTVRPVTVAASSGERRVADADPLDPVDAVRQQQPPVRMTATHAATTGAPGGLSASPSWLPARPLTWHWRRVSPLQLRRTPTTTPRCRSHATLITSVRRHVTILAVRSWPFPVRRSTPTRWLAVHRTMPRHLLGGLPRSRLRADRQVSHRTERPAFGSMGNQ